MKRFKTALYLVSVASCALANSAAFAQSLPGPNDGDSALHGTGATSIQNVLVQELNCKGATDFQLGNANGTFTTIPEPTDLTTPSGTFNCTNQSLDSFFAAKYVGTGSGFGRQAWRSLTNQFGGTNLNPFAPSAWNTVQFAFADSSIQPTDLTAYNTTNNVDSVGGAAIMIPKFVLPVAIAYNPLYGEQTVGATVNKFYFNVQGATDQGGLNLGRPVYCRIFNGDIKNWNDPAFTAANGSHSLMDPSDDSTRWSTAGVPIRLVGRMDSSGTTDIFTRALAQQCTGVTGADGMTVVPNKYTMHAEGLPYNSASNITFVSERLDTPYQVGGPATAGTTNTIGREFFNQTANAIQVSASSTGTDSSAPIGTGTLRNQGSGFFLVANGSGAVRDAINFGPDWQVDTTSTLLVNGKLGYISADFINGSPTGSSQLRAARLSQNPGVVPFNFPTAPNAITAVGTVLPPQSNSDGSFNATDARQVRDNASSTGTPLVSATRNNPFGWYDVFYPTTGATLAQPTTGYAITGTTQALLYTCYRPANLGPILDFLSWNYDDVLAPKLDDSSVNRSGIFTATTTLGGFNGLLARSNIGALPEPWKRAIRDTFLTNASGRNLDIEAGGSGRCATVAMLPGESTRGM